MSEDLTAEVEGKCADFRLLFARIPRFVGDDELTSAEVSELLPRLARLCGDLGRGGVFLREMDEFVGWYGKQLLCPADAVRQSITLESEREELLAKANGWIPRAMNPKATRNNAKIGRREKPIEDAEIAADVYLLRTPGLSRSQAEERRSALKRAGKPLPREARDEVPLLMKDFNLSKADAEIAALMKHGRFTEAEAEARAQEVYRGASAKHAVDRARKRRRNKNPD